MKTAEELFYNLNGWTRNDIINMIRCAQIDAYNQAIEDAYESARTRTNDESTSIIVDKESILKLKR